MCTRTLPPTHLCIIVSRGAVLNCRRAIPDHMHGSVWDNRIDNARMPHFLLPLDNRQTPGALVRSIDQLFPYHFLRDLTLIGDRRAFKSGLPELHPLVEGLIIANCTVIIFVSEATPHIRNGKWGNRVERAGFIVFTATSNLKIFLCDYWLS